MHHLLLHPQSDAWIVLQSATFSPAKFGAEVFMRNDNTPFALVADDDALIRMDAAQILQDVGFHVHEACGVEEAIAILERASDRIQILFTDVQMPPGDLNGFHLARVCAERWPHISIIVASGMIQPGSDDMPHNARFVRKPFSAEVVYEHLQQILPDGRKPEPLRQRPV